MVIHLYYRKKDSCHLQLISLCVAHRIKHLTMLLCVMLCQLRSIYFGVTNLKRLWFLPTVDIYVLETTVSGKHQSKNADL